MAGVDKRGGRTADVRIGDTAKRSAKVKKVHTSFEMEEELHDRLRMHVASSPRGTKQSAVLNEAVRYFLGKHQKGRKYLDSADRFAEDMAGGQAEGGEAEDAAA